MNYREKAAALSAEDRAELVGSVRSAVYHLLECWDSLHEAETALEGNIETEYIESFASRFFDPDDALAASEEDILELLAGIEEDEDAG